MRTATKIKLMGVKIYISPWFLDYYTPLGYVTAQSVQGGEWVEVCATDTCGVYAPEYGWQFETDISCDVAIKMYKFIKPLLDAPDWPVFVLIAMAVADLKSMIDRECIRS